MEVEMGVKLNDLPMLPFQKILSYPSLEDCIKSRAVSRRWYQLIDSFRVKSLCYSGCLIFLIRYKRKLVNGAFAQNFISLSSFQSFFAASSQSILSNLKHLRLCHHKIHVKDKAIFAQALNRIEFIRAIGRAGHHPIELPKSWLANWSRTKPADAQRHSNFVRARNPEADIGCAKTADGQTDGL